MQHWEQLGGQDAVSMHRNGEVAWIAIKGHGDEMD